MPVTDDLTGTGWDVPIDKKELDKELVSLLKAFDQRKVLQSRSFLQVIKNYIFKK